MDPSNSVVRRGFKTLEQTPSSDIPHHDHDEEDQDQSNTLELEMEVNSHDQKQQQSNTKQNDDSKISRYGFYVLGLLACQNCFKNLFMRYVMVEQPKFLLSTAIIIVEILKFFIAAIFITFYQKQPLNSIYKFIFKDDWKNSLLLSLPAACYIVQMTLEYIAFANIDAASFSVLVQTKQLFTALFFRTILGKRLQKKQAMSLVILTVGVMLCNFSGLDADETVESPGIRMKGIIATLGIALTSGFASVYTEKVIKSSRKNSSIKDKDRYGLAHMQCQLALVSLIILGFYAAIKDSKEIMKNGFMNNFNAPAFFSCVNSSVGGLIVAAVLKYADSVLKGYATAVSVIMTGVASTQLFGTHLSMVFGMGMINVVVSVLLYNLTDLEDFCV